MGADLWSYTGAVKKVVYDNDGQPVGGDANKLTTFLGCIACNGELFPVSTPARSGMKDEYLKKAWAEIQKRFTADHPNGKRKIMTIMNSRWRDWKSNLKTKHFVLGDRAKSIENISGKDRVNLNPKYLHKIVRIQKNCWSVILWALNQS